MPCVNYRRRAENSERRFFASAQITDVNKEHVRRFLRGYDVSHGRLCIFFDNITRFLRNSRDIQSEMHDRDAVNAIFGKLRAQYARATCGTVSNVTNRLARWLNEGVRPKGFADVHGPSLKDQLRTLRPSDMLTWADINQLGNYTTSIQIQAALPVQLDGGFRPGEFIGLNYGDIERHGDIVGAEVTETKTGASRTVYLFESVPALDRWLRNHPTKRAEDPLWVQERGSVRHLKRYNYPSLAKTTSRLGEMAGVTKPLDFYNFRHSAVAIKKKQGMDIRWCCRNFGHSVVFHEKVYGRLSKDDDINMLRRHYGINAQTEQLNRPQNITCSRCKTVNPARDGHGKASDICQECTAPLTLKKAMDFGRTAEVEAKLHALQEQYDKLSGQLAALGKVERFIDAKLGDARSGP